MTRDTFKHVTRALLGLVAVGVFAAASLGGSGTPVAAQSIAPDVTTPFLASVAGPRVTFAGGDLAPDALVTLVVRSRAFAGTRTMVAQTDGAGHVRADALVCSRIAALALEATVTDEAGASATTAFIAPPC